jgi:hypothetical protein
MNQCGPLTPVDEKSNVPKVGDCSRRTRSQTNGSTRLEPVIHGSKVEHLVLSKAAMPLSGSSIAHAHHWSWVES